MKKRKKADLPFPPQKSRLRRFEAGENHKVEEKREERQSSLEVWTNSSFSSCWCHIYMYTWHQRREALILNVPKGIVFVWFILLTVKACNRVKWINEFAQDITFHPKTTYYHSINFVGKTWQDFNWIIWSVYFINYVDRNSIHCICSSFF